MEYALAYTRESIASLGEQLQDLQPTESDEVSKQAAIRLLLPQLLGMQERGFSFDQMAGALTARGLALAPATLKNYMQRAQNGRSKKSKGGKKNHSPKSRQPSQPVPQSRISTKPSVEDHAISATANKSGTFSVRPDTDEI